MRSPADSQGKTIQDCGRELQENGQNHRAVHSGVPEGRCEGSRSVERSGTTGSISNAYALRQEREKQPKTQRFPSNQGSLLSSFKSALPSKHSSRSDTVTGSYYRPVFLASWFPDSSLLRCRRLSDSLQSFRPH